MISRIASVRVLLQSIVLCSSMVATIQAQTGIWATAYYAGWKQGWHNNGHLKAQDIDYSAATHFVHFSLVPNADGTLDSNANSITPVNSSEFVARAHAAGKRVLISVGGWGSDTGFRGATTAMNLEKFIRNLLNFMTVRGYDGIDVDWEVLEHSDAEQYVAFIVALRTELRRRESHALLTVATSWQPGVHALVHPYVDQINIMTYDMSGAWPGWVTWHNSPIFSGGFLFPNSSRQVPSAESEIDAFIASGVPAKKLGIGIDFYGYVWTGGSGTSTGGTTQPRQSWNSPPTVRGNVPYHSIMDDYYSTENYRWDDVAQAAYLNMDSSGSFSDMFVSFDNEAAVQKKIEYVRSKGIGGVIIWELGGGYRPELPAGQRDGLLQAVKRALAGEAHPDPEIPSQFSLRQNYPNPFNPATTIEFFLPERAFVFMRIYNLLDERVAAPISKELPAGNHKQLWNASRFSSGTYLLRLDVWIGTTQVFVKTVKLLLLN